MNTEEMMNSLPDEISFSEETIRSAAEKDTLAEGWYQFLIVQAERQLSKSGRYMLKLNCIPLAKENNPETKVSNLGIRHYVVLPHTNPAMEIDDEAAEAKRQKSLGHNFGRFLRACFGSDEEGIPDNPKWIDGVPTYRGEEIDPSEEQACRQEVARAIYDMGTSLWKPANTDDLINLAFFGKVIENGQYMNIQTVSEEIPDGVELSVPGSKSVVLAKEPEPEPKSKQKTRKKPLN